MSIILVWFAGQFDLGEENQGAKVLWVLYSFVLGLIYDVYILSKLAR